MSTTKVCIILSTPSVYIINECKEYPDSQLGRLAAAFSNRATLEIPRNLVDKHNDIMNKFEELQHELEYLFEFQNGIIREDKELLPGFRILGANNGT